MDLSKIERYDMKKIPCKQNRILQLLILMISKIGTIGRHVKFIKVNMDDMKGPHLILFNHMSQYDFMVMARLLYPRRFNYVISIDGNMDAAFTGCQEFIMRHYGSITKRKFTNDLTLIKQMKHAITKNKQDIVMFPEARYSVHGANAVLPDSLGKMVKLFEIPVVVVNMRGNYLADPFWSDHKHKNKVPLEATVTKVFAKEDIGNFTIEEINETIRKHLVYNEYDYQLEKGFLIKGKKRAEGMHKILYKCPVCGKEYETDSKGEYIWCNNCSSKWHLEENSTLKTVEGKEVFTKVIDWFNWEREEVRKEVINGTYYFDDDVIIHALPNVKKFITLGKGHLTHTINEGFHLTYKDEENDIDIVRTPQSMYSCHIEFNYRDKGDCLDISTLDDTFFVHPVNYTNVLGKFNFAVEEIYNYHKEIIESKKLQNKEDK